MEFSEKGQLCKIQGGGGGSQRGVDESEERAAQLDQH